MHVMSPSNVRVRPTPMAMVLYVLIGAVQPRSVTRPKCLVASFLWQSLFASVLRHRKRFNQGQWHLSWVLQLISQQKLKQWSKRSASVAQPASHAFLNKVLPVTVDVVLLGVGQRV
ncbi:hypothetical protein H257_11113 [Aphanomyces astaci]|uniref:Uncharacterized protein n=1 Tax=Aphanomyces astaci TaxID=112090 RepID=W4G5E8_APHAT|nr:hypothetical protein H257_11113 [Aphanomyces astaci]ETV74148.1 hypothetical protein H257_11113 [Aphanomyces astaci]|eukprot:XP_009836254.1 hypothetical protein H257_11113 [Aphanomyces astaci]